MKPKVERQTARFFVYWAVTERELDGLPIWFVQLRQDVIKGETLVLKSSTYKTREAAIAHFNQMIRTHVNPYPFKNRIP